MGGELQQAAVPLNQTLERSHVVVSDENWNGTGAENFQKTVGSRRATRRHEGESRVKKIHEIVAIVHSSIFFGTSCLPRLPSHKLVVGFLPATSHDYDILPVVHTSESFAAPKCAFPRQVASSFEGGEVLSLEGLHAREFRR